MYLSSLPSRKNDTVMQEPHPYLTGNYAPLSSSKPLTPCTYTGELPSSLAGGQYVRNGGNPILNEDLGRDSHWFDGDGMLTGVLFRKLEDGSISPEFTSRWIETDIWRVSMESTPKSGSNNKSRGRLRKPIPPSIATLVNPTAGFFAILWTILRTVLIVLSSHLPWSKSKIKRISVANTGIYYHDGRALATCESGPPIRIQLPGLDTVGWFNGVHADGELVSQGERAQPLFGGTGALSFFREFTTGHPKIDTESGEMLLFHNTLFPPYVQYSIIPPENPPISTEKMVHTGGTLQRMLNVPVPGVASPKLMHDFGASASRTVILDLPISLDPLNLLRGRPIVAYDPLQPARFGIFPRHCPDQIIWFEDAPCIIFHTASTWDEYDDSGNVVAVCMLACRMTSPTLVYSAGNLPMPLAFDARKRWRHPDDGADEEQPPKRMGFFQKYDDDETHPPRFRSYGSCEEDAVFDKAPDLECHSLRSPTMEDPLLPRSLSQAPETIEDLDQCRLHFFRFPLKKPTASRRPRPSHSFPLSSLQLEFPTTAPGKSLSLAHYVYACSSTSASFTVALGKAVKIDIIAKVNAPALISCGLIQAPRVGRSVDSRTAEEIISCQDNSSRTSGTEADAIQLFKLPDRIYGQEPRFVPNRERNTEDDGHLLFFVFDEAQLSSAGEAPSWAVSELWILDARGMKDVVAKVKLGHRVPYGLHGEWFAEKMIVAQREWVDRNKEQGQNKTVRIAG